MNRLLYYLELIRGKPGMVYVFRFLLRDAINDVLIDAECSAVSFGCDIEGEIGIAQTFRDVRLELDR